MMETAPLGASLDSVTGNGRWTRPQRRLFHRAMSGIEYQQTMGRKVRFLTLTSAPQSVDLHGHFRALVKRLRRAWGLFEYIAVKETTENGLLHLHILYVGPWILQAWISRIWSELHGARIVFIQGLHGSKKALGAYLVKYLSKQKGRYWGSWNWVFPSYVHRWHQTLTAYGWPRALAAWKQQLRSWALFGVPKTLSLNRLA